MPSSGRRCYKLRDRALVILWFLASFGLSAVRDIGVLLACLAALAVLGQARRTTRLFLKTLLLPLGLLVSLSFLYVRLIQGHWPDFMPFLVMGLRALNITFLSLVVVRSVNFFEALSPWPGLVRLFVIVLAQIHVLRRLVTESREALTVRLPRRPEWRDVTRSAGGAAAAVVALAVQNARETSEAIRSRTVQ